MTHTLQCALVAQGLPGAGVESGAQCRALVPTAGVLHWRHHYHAAGLWDSACGGREGRGRWKRGVAGTQLLANCGSSLETICGPKASDCLFSTLPTEKLARRVMQLSNALAHEDVSWEPCGPACEA